MTLIKTKINNTKELRRKTVQIDFFLCVQYILSLYFPVKKSVNLILASASYRGRGYVIFREKMEFFIGMKAPQLKPCSNGFISVRISFIICFM